MNNQVDAVTPKCNYLTVCKKAQQGKKLNVFVKHHAPNYILVSTKTQSKRGITLTKLINFFYYYYFFKKRFGDLLLNPNKLIKFQGSSSNSYWDILLTRKAWQVTGRMYEQKNDPKAIHPSNFLEAGDIMSCWNSCSSPNIKLRYTLGSISLQTCYEHS